MKRQIRTVLLSATVAMFAFSLLFTAYAQNSPGGGHLQANSTPLLWPMDHAYVWSITLPRPRQGDKVSLVIRESRPKKGLNGDPSVPANALAHEYRTDPESTINGQASVAVQLIDLDQMRITSRENGKNVRLITRLQAGSATSGSPLLEPPPSTTLAGMGPVSEPKWEGNQLRLMIFSLWHYNGPEPTGTSVDTVTTYEVILQLVR